jgi:3-methyladenine DNA glycosylase AlkD
MLDKLRAEMKRQSSPARAKSSQWFFKTGPGQYGEGDKFIGITVPALRTVAKSFAGLSLVDIKKLLYSKIHEERLIAVFILGLQFAKADHKLQDQIVRFYLAHTKQINNWDLVDSSADRILGQYLLDKPKNILYKLAKSKNLWEKRIAIIATYQFIKNNQFADTMKISEMLLGDSHDLIHKAVGWMLRETGKRDLKTEIKFLDRHYTIMPRTSLRYAIERLPDKFKKHYMKKP